MHQDKILLDDGEFYVELNGNFDPATAPGFLQRRCTRSVTTPGGYECVGSFQLRPNGTWSADVAAPLDEESGSDCLVLTSGASRMDAITALWKGRPLAYLRA